MVGNGLIEESIEYEKYETFDMLLQFFLSTHMCTVGAILCRTKKLLYHGHFLTVVKTS